MPDPGSSPGQAVIRHTEAGRPGGWGPGFLPRIKYGVTFFRRNDGRLHSIVICSRTEGRRPSPTAIVLERCPQADRHHSSRLEHFPAGKRILPGDERRARVFSCPMRWDSAVATDSRRAGLQKEATEAPAQLGPGP